MIYFINTNQENIISSVVNTKGKGSETIHLELSEDNLLDFISKAASIDLFGDSVNYIIRKNFLFSKKIKKKTEPFVPKFILALVNSDDDFFFIHDSKLTIPSLFSKAWGGNLELIEIKNTLSWERNDLNKWITLNAIDIEKITLDTLISNLGEDFNAVKSELTKLSMVDKKKITTLTISENSYLTLEGNVFVVINLLFNKKVTKALAIFNSLLKSGTNPITFLEIFITQLRFYYQVKLLLEDNSVKDIATLLKTSPYRINQSLTFIRTSGAISLTNTYIKTSNIEYLVKTGNLNPDLIFFQLSNSI